MCVRAKSVLMRSIVSHSAVEMLARYFWFTPRAELIVSRHDRLRGPHPSSVTSLHLGHGDGAGSAGYSRAWLHAKNITYNHDTEPRQSANTTNKIHNEPHVN